MLQGRADLERDTAEPRQRVLETVEEGFLTASEKQVKKSEIGKLCGHGGLCCLQGSFIHIVYQMPDT